MRPGRMALVALALVLVLVPAVAVASGPARPAAGKWKLGGGGGFTVSKDRKSISGLHIKPGPGSGCGTGTISVKGSQKLSQTSRGGFTNWIVGRSTPKTSSGVSTIKVKVSQAGHTVTGGLYIIFGVAGSKRDNSGELLAGSSCLMTLSASK